ncbi:hypothetical protein FRC03_010990 [Tulasnella sp. 419]|nr:hypothetical protein FRC03_010990 [Tulasnella sp. 419]
MCMKKVLREHSELIEKHTFLEGSLWDHIDRLISLSSVTQQKDADNAALFAVGLKVDFESGSASDELGNRAQAVLLAAAACADEIGA